jgi:predicted lipoprotein with Yx(FWY)xxD motif
MKTSVLAAAAGAVLLAGLGGCANNPFRQAETPVQLPPSQPAYPMNGVLATPTGMTLYTFDKDTANAATSACTGPCATLWPPFLAAADAAPIGGFTLVTRDDGTKQWAYRGWPVYTYSKDARAGDMAGDNFKNVWHAAKP